ncbi:hypothetical protein DTL70_21605 [Streptomyces diacarni]|uniref:CofH/MqnC-like C-terminal domain-containing protein n=1 Tax=Streptomyces diacarni TaxID=2800381 RepID=A0A367ES43_9ACTN|nr:hypothetical protein [Streptomyces diacarni]RCG20861.1 hypothetical protein DTL70_21605 [Streptomyces diacarni]
MDAELRRRLADVERKVRSGERLGHEDGVALFASDDLAWLGGLAHEARALKNGDVAYFAEHRRLELPAEADAVNDTDAMNDMVEAATRLAADGATELHLGAAGDTSWEQWVRALRALRAALPEAVALRAFTAADVSRFAAASQVSESEVLDELLAAAPASLGEGFEGPGAEAADAEDAEDVAREAEGAGWQDWARVHRMAHHKGLTTVCTLRFGYGEELAERVDHLLRLRELQDETGGFRAVVPLRHEGPQGATGAEVLATFAVCRLLLDNVAHVAARWAVHGAQTSQLALQHGADEMAGPPAAEASRDADVLTRDDLVELIRDTGFRPVERDAHHGVLRSFDGPDPDRREAPQPMRV